MNVLCLGSFESDDSLPLMVYNACVYLESCTLRT